MPADSSTPRHMKMLGPEPTIHPSSRLNLSKLGEWTDIGPNVQLSETTVGDYTYFAGDASAVYATIG